MIGGSFFTGSRLLGALLESTSLTGRLSPPLLRCLKACPHSSIELRLRPVRGARVDDGRHELASLAPLAADPPFSSHRAPRPLAFALLPSPLARPHAAASLPLTYGAPRATTRSPPRWPSFSCCWAPSSPTICPPSAPSSASTPSHHLTWGATAASCTARPRR